MRWRLICCDSADKTNSLDRRLNHKMASPTAMRHSCHPSSGLRKMYLEKSNTRIVRHPRIAPIDFLNLDTVINSYISGPEIEWNPSFSTFQSRVELLSKLHLPRPQSLPPGFPETIQAPWAWNGSEYRHCENYVLQLGKSDIEEIESALNRFKGKLYTDASTQRLFIEITKV